MKKFSILVLITIFLMPCAVNAAKRKPAAKGEPMPKPVVVLLGAGAENDAKSIDQMTVNAVASQLTALGNIDLIVFKADLPAVKRAMMENRLTQQSLESISDPKIIMQITNMLDADYALRVVGSIMPAYDLIAGAKVPAGSEAVVILDLYKSSGEHWSSRKSSRIASGPGPTQDAKERLAIGTAASAVVSDAGIRILGQDAFLTASMIAPRPAPSSVIVRDVESDYLQAIARAQNYSQEHDTPNAVVELKRAINLKPTDSAARLRLARVYLDARMPSEAINECKRALLLKPNDAAVSNLLVKLYLENGSLADAAAICREIVRLNPSNIDARLLLGDILWNQSKIVEAEKAYKEVAELSPDNPVPHENLRKLYLARKMYASALNQLFQFKLITATAKSAEARDAVAARMIRDEFRDTIDEITAAEQDYQLGKIKREDYYAESKNFALRITALDNFVAGQSASSAYKQAYPHMSLAISLLEQANASTITFLETEKPNYAEQATLLRAEARTESGLYDSNLKT